MFNDSMAKSFTFDLIAGINEKLNQTSTRQILLLLDSPFRRSLDNYVLEIVKKLKNDAAQLFVVHLPDLDAQDRQVLENELGGREFLVTHIEQEIEMKKLCYFK